MAQVRIVSHVSPTMRPAVLLIAMLCYAMLWYWTCISFAATSTITEHTVLHSMQAAITQTCKPLLTIHQPTSPCVPPIKKNRPRLFARGLLIYRLAAKYRAGPANTSPKARPHIRCTYSIQYMNLNSSSVILLTFNKRLPRSDDRSRCVLQLSCMSGGSLYNCMAQ